MVVPNPNPYGATPTTPLLQTEFNNTGSRRNLSLGQVAGIFAAIVAVSGGFLYRKELLTVLSGGSLEHCECLPCGESNFVHEIGGKRHDPKYLSGSCTRPSLACSASQTGSGCYSSQENYGCNCGPKKRYEDKSCHCIKCGENVAHPFGTGSCNVKTNGCGPSAKGGGECYSSRPDKGCDCENLLQIDE